MNDRDFHVILLFMMVGGFTFVVWLFVGLEAKIDAILEELKRK